VTNAGPADYVGPAVEGIGVKAYQIIPGNKISLSGYNINRNQKYVIKKRLNCIFSNLVKAIYPFDGKRLKD
jgi:hypothetical protein